MTRQFYCSYGEHRLRSEILAIASVWLLVLGIILSPGASTASAATAPLFSQLRDGAQLLVVAAHRGGQESAPENTIEALRAALAEGVDVVETDVHLSADGVPVLIHDFSLDRTTNGSGPIWNRTADELKRLDAGSWYSEQYAGVAVPTLIEFLEALRGSPSFAILELKGPWMADGLETVAAEIRGSGLENRVMVASFDAMSLAKLARIAPEIQRIIIARDIVGDALRLAAYCGAVAV
ncbi:MAG: hypothetical protein LH471_07300, partial [Salinibacterium sp.]|nr:hypothetical protein [Salinibacterium sp.]